MNVDLETHIDSLINYLPLLSAMLIMAGFIKMFLYFKFFKINIIDFIEFSEVVTWFMDNLVAFLILLIYSLTNLYFITSFNLDFSLESVKTLPKVFPPLPSDYNYYLFLISISIVLFVFYRTAKHIYFYEFLLLIISIWLIVPFFILKIVNYRLIYPNANISAIILISVSILLMIYVILSCYSELYKVIKKNFYSNYNFKFSNTISFKSDDCIYVGKTKNYYFFLNSDTDDTHIISSSEISHIIINK